MNETQADIAADAVAEVSQAPVSNQPDLVLAVPVMDEDETVLPPPKPRYMPPGAKRTYEQQQADFAVIEELLGKHRNYREILDAVNALRPYKLTRQTVERDIRTIKKRFFDSFVGPLAERKVDECRKLERLEREAFDAWERSKADGMTVSVTNPLNADGSPGRGGLRTNNKRRRDGDPQFLTILLRIHERRCKLLGLEAPLKMEMEVNGQIVHGLDMNNLRNAFRNTVLAEAQLKASQGTSADVRKELPAPEDESNPEADPAKVNPESKSLTFEVIPPGLAETPLPGEESGAI